jgi:hypothetical protein
MSRLGSLVWINSEPQKSAVELAAWKETMMHVLGPAAFQAVDIRCGRSQGGHSRVVLDAATWREMAGHLLGPSAFQAVERAVFENVGSRK